MSERKSEMTEQRVRDTSLTRFHFFSISRRLTQELRKAYSLTRNFRNAYNTPCGFCDKNITNEKNRKFMKKKVKKVSIKITKMKDWSRMYPGPVTSQSWIG